MPYDCGTRRCDLCLTERNHQCEICHCVCRSRTSTKQEN